MAALIRLWSSLLPGTLTPTQVDDDLRRHGLDVPAVRELVDTLSRDLGPEFAAGVLAGIRFALACPRRKHWEPKGKDRGRVIPFPGRLKHSDASAAS